MSDKVVNQETPLINIKVSDDIQSAIATPQWFRDMFDWTRRKPLAGPASVLKFIEVVVSKFVLEVLGASGAVWGCADFLSLRNTPMNEERVRLVAILVGLIFSVRYFWTIKHFYQHGRDYLPIKTIHRRTHKLSFAQIHSSKFLLQVMGGAGAIWGSAEIATLRNPGNRSSWVVIASIFLSIFFVRWVLQVLAYLLYMPSLWADESSVQMKAVRWMDAVPIFIILDVLGAAGAIWGSSEVATLRNAETVEFWRLIASGVGFVFAVRWLVYFVDFVKSERESLTAKYQIQETEIGPNETLDLNLHDLSLEEGECFSSPAKEEGRDASSPHRRAKKQFSTDASD